MQDLCFSLCFGTVDNETIRKQLSVVKQLLSKLTELQAVVNQTHQELDERKARTDSAVEKLEAENGRLRGMLNEQDRRNNETKEALRSTRLELERLRKARNELLSVPPTEDMEKEAQCEHGKCNDIEQKWE